MNTEDPSGPIVRGFDDVYNFSSFSENPQTYDGFFQWDGPGPEIQIQHSVVTTGNTKVAKNYPKATITLAFTPGGTKNSQDNLNFVPTGTHTCSNTLGPKDCTAFTGWWLYDLEGTVVVSDDASKWTVKQTKNSIVYSGNTKDANGVLHPFSNTIPFNNAPDGPDAPGTLQQASGSTTIFWLDAPGRNSLGDDGNPIDSLTWVQNYTMNVCSTVLTSICSTKSWYVKLVVNPGGLLSPTASIAALGSSN